jgi:hypothetical protein
VRRSTMTVFAIFFALTLPGIAAAKRLAPAQKTASFGCTFSTHGSQQKRYLRLYKQVSKREGKRAPGRNIVCYGVKHGRHLRPATSTQVRQSMDVLQRILNPPPVATYSPSASSATSSSAGSAQSTSSSGQTAQTASTSGSAAPSSGLAACIVQRESSGNPQDVSGQYSGLANWSQEAWQDDGGTKYAPTPTGASASQQMSVLNSALAAGKSGQWTPYDGC